MKKLRDRIEFSSERNFNVVMDQSHQNDGSHDSLYESYGIVVHYASKLGYSHYAFIQSFDGKHWFRMNDIKQIQANEIRVLKQQAYLLFYRRKSHRELENEMNQNKVQTMIDQNEKINKSHCIASIPEVIANKIVITEMNLDYVLQCLTQFLLILVLYQ